ncbi:hypothetical protein N9X02_04620 [Planktomarina temperata]|nr:hypothetical protein [Planktomarina temperata]
MNTRVTRRLNFSGQFKAAVALKVLRGDKMVQKIGQAAALLKAGAHVETARDRRHGRCFL